LKRSVGCLGKRAYGDVVHSSDRGTVYTLTIDPSTTSARLEVLLGIDALVDDGLSGFNGTSGPVERTNSEGFLRSTSRDSRVTAGSVSDTSSPTGFETGVASESTSGCTGSDTDGGRVGHLVRACRVGVDLIRATLVRTCATVNDTKLETYKRGGLVDQELE
jgi:hypothetical protein